MLGPPRGSSGSRRSGRRASRPSSRTPFGPVDSYALSQADPASYKNKNALRLKNKRMLKSNTPQRSETVDLDGFNAKTGRLSLSIDTDSAPQGPDPRSSPNVSPKFVQQTILHLRKSGLNPGMSSHDKSHHKVASTAFHKNHEGGNEMGSAEAKAHLRRQVS
jgi:hypothetical protein